MNTQYEESPFSKFVFGNTKMSWFWLIVRLYLGYSWLMAGLHKVASEAWVGANAGGALTGFLNGALAKTVGEHPDVQGFYANFIQNTVLPHVSFWSHLVAWGEVLVGVALIIGIFTGIAAFFGVLMNLNFMLAGAVSVNPILGVLGLFVMMAWRIAGYYGADKYVLPELGTFWQPGKVFNKV